MSVDYDQAPLAGRVILVTGAHGGLGTAASKACARAGATVVLMGRRVRQLERLHDAIAAVSKAPVLYPLDMEGASPDDYNELAQRIDDNYGRLDGLLHCAADFRGLTPIEHTDPAAFARSVHIGVTAPTWLTQACLPVLRKSKDASVVFVVDDLTRVSGAYWGGYGVAQHARVGLVSTLHAELGKTSVRVAGLQPGPMRTGLRAKAFVDDMDRDARDPAFAADACVELLSPAGAEYRGEIAQGASGSLE
ncbi:SDR family NAD(P)-dependent oxidoreductase [Lysobacter sp. A6]|uniref:SDR family NAD(P)-dependent oxidoreductase n=1 Tax=Noviluteimonas lactosilytica TaxID=2888523 RepID=A0ABS8JJU3_9GAMM|nr:SDR family NAD(P)-dependent oxidoreductase [Lysobacter lactosilyticus]